jgi:hypothetical protein
MIKKLRRQDAAQKLFTRNSRFDDRIKRCGGADQIWRTA